MSRLTISLPENLHNRIASLAIRNNDSLSNIINQLIQVGLHHWFENKDRSQDSSLVEQHCQQLIIQMNALIKNISVELLKFNIEDFEKLQQAAAVKYSELHNIHHESF
jgi:metal-responsive CopG/Arc/MetJ family transcriptional regulator